MYRSRLCRPAFKIVLLAPMRALFISLFRAVNLFTPFGDLFAADATSKSTLAQVLPDAPSHVSASNRAKPAAQSLPQSAQGTDAPWPREAEVGAEKISVYQPQLDSWEGDEIRAYAALALQNKQERKTKYGVVWFTARTEVDKVNRQVTLDNFQITKIRFPTMASKEAQYQTFLQEKLPGKTKIIALDRLEAALLASESADSRVHALP